MKHGLVILFVAFLAFVSVGQKNCQCPTIDTYFQKKFIDSTIVYSPENLKILGWKYLKSTNPRCKSFGYHLIAQDYLNNYQFEAAKKNLEKELFLLDSIHCFKVGYLVNTISFGDYYLRVGENELALSSFQKALVIIGKNKAHPLYPKVLLSLSTAFSKLKTEDKSINYLKLAHNFVNQLPNNTYKVDNLFSLSARYYHHFEISNDLPLLDSAHQVALTGLRLAKKMKYEQSYVKGYNLLEDKSYHDRNYRKAILFLDSALFYTYPTNQLVEREGIFSDLTDIYLELKRYDKAYQFADSTLTSALALNNPYKVKSALELVYTCAKLSGEYERALTVYEDLVTMRDSVVKLQNLRAFNDLEEKYHRVRKQKDADAEEQDKKLLEQQRQIGNLKHKLIVVGLIILALLGFYIFMVFRQRKISERQKNLELQHRLNRARINPEFIYNTLAVLQSMGDTQVLSKKIGAFSKLIKQTLESTHDDFLTVDKELAFLSYYIELQQDKYPNLFDVKFEIDDAIDQADVCLPTMILQPFIENTITKGFKNIAYKGQLNVKFFLTPNQELVIMIQDNGRGLKAVDSLRASEIINDRLYILNKVNKSSSSYLIRERQSGGVSVEIYLPLITKAFAEQLKNEADD
jgi:tetratricopeptide (TPR) repeat protein